MDSIYLHIKGLENMPQELISQIASGDLTIEQGGQTGYILWKFIRTRDHSLYRAVEIYERNED